jgi:hypothetical protein
MAAALFSLFLFPVLAAAEAGPLPVRGLHLRVLKPAEAPAAVRFIREALPKEGVNLLVLEIGYHYRFEKHPEVSDPDPLSKDDLAMLAAACRQAGVRLIPQINLLGHQSWQEKTWGLLRAHPEFDETPGKYPENKGIYCRSYCPLHPQLRAVVADLIDELVEATQADAFHAGLDEVFLLGEDDCLRCRGRSKAELFAHEVRSLRDHLARTGRRLWIWGDRLLDGSITGIGRWEASLNGTDPAIRMIPKDVVICDWHYERLFALEGFSVVSAPWRRPEVALAQLDLIRDLRKQANQAAAGRALGVLQTSWGPMGDFIRAYNGEESSERTREAVKCFRELFAEIRKGGLQ